MSASSEAGAWRRVPSWLCACTMYSRDWGHRCSGNLHTIPVHTQRETTARNTTHFSVPLLSSVERHHSQRACLPRPFFEPLAEVLEQKVPVKGWQFGVEMVQGPRGPVPRAYLQALHVNHCVHPTSSQTLYLKLCFAIFIVVC